MIGGAVFSSQQNMSECPSPGTVLIGWLISGVGMLALAFVYQGLST
jgi:arginine:ornithine antiporter / lysine permease